jgi:hypothetical protein
VHVLVAEAFLGPRPEGQEVNHKDFERTNNRLANLEWVTKKENLRHLLASGRKKNQRIGEGAVRLIRGLASLGRFSNRELGDMFGVKPYVAWYITTGGLTPRWSGRVKNKVPSSDAGVRAAQLNR